MWRESPCQLGECALSVVIRRGGPSGSPAGDTGHTDSTPSWIAAILVPSGDHTGPPPPRESIDRSGTGANHLSPPLPSAANVSTWLVPSRNLVDIGATLASAMRLPSGDHVGVPGCGSWSWIFVTVPVATSTTEMGATRHMPSTLKNTMR